MSSKSTARPRTILLVDDDYQARLTTKWFLSSFGFTVDTARSGEEALATFDPKIHEIVVTDNFMPGLSGAELAHVIKLRSPRTPVVMYTGHAPSDRSCVDAVLQRPTDLLNLRSTIEALLAGPPGPSPSTDPNTQRTRPN